MTKRVNNYFNHKNRKNFFDVDRDDLMGLVETGYKTEDIARELCISKEQVDSVRNEID